MINDEMTQASPESDRRFDDNLLALRRRNLLGKRYEDKLARAYKVLYRKKMPNAAAANMHSALGSWPKALMLTVASAMVNSNKNLDNLLRDHRIKEIKYAEIEPRVTIDNALECFELIEMAVRTGYLPVNDEGLLNKIRGDLLHLIVLPPVWNFIEIYDYKGVASLSRRIALRTDFDAGSTETPPPITPIPDSEFATFLSLVFQYEDDKCIEAWCDVLDDYVTDADEETETSAETILEFTEKLSDGSRVILQPDSLFAEAVEGIGKFVNLIENIDKIGNRIKDVPFILYFRYWVLRFCGWRLEKSGYIQESIDWSAELRNRIELFPEYSGIQRSSKELNDARKHLNRRLKRLETIAREFTETYVPKKKKKK